MAGRIPENFIQDLLARTDIVELIDARVPLKKTGRNYSACCPFHNEKTPSFTVAPDKQFYYCFGCGATGNAVGFLMEYDRLSFPEAVEQLAQRAGLEVPRERDGAGPSKEQRDRLQSLYDLLTRADRFYRQQLKSAPERDRAVKYLKGRGLTGEVAARFGLGFAPPGFDNLITGLSLDETGLEQALTVGLLVRREDTGRVYDKFRDRIMFPIRDTRGRTLGFGGRLLGDGKPKYLNSPETPVFHKGRELYGLWEWRQSREKSDRLFVVEGYMDVIALHQFGIHNVVATLGTATTSDHAEKLFRQVDEVVFCFDGDDAGRRAAWRALESTLPKLDDGKQSRFLFLPEGEDPDTLVRREGPEALLAAAEKAPSLATFLFNHLSEGLDLESVDGRARLAKIALPLIQQVRGEAYGALLRRELADRTRLSLEELNKLAEHHRPRPATPVTQEPPPRQAMNEAPDPVNERPAPSFRTGHRRPAGRGPTFTLAEKLTALLLEQPGLPEKMPLPEGLEELNDPQADLLIQVAQEIRNRPDATAAALLGSLMALEQGDTLSRILRASLRLEHDEKQLERVWHDGLQQLEIHRLEAAIDRETASEAPDAARLAELHSRLTEARGRLNAPLE